jgi:hypothetical protein
MPYCIQAESRLLRVTYTGHVTEAELFETARELAALRATYERQPDQLTDYSGIETQDTNFELLQPISAELKKRVFLNEFRVALLAPTPVSFGLARMFQSLIDHPKIYMKIFKSHDEAEKWLAPEAAKEHD